MKRKKSAKERGITLVALIITIIVILILVGVTIGQITGSDGIIKRAQNSTAEYKQKSAEEKVALLMQEYQYDKMEKGLKGEEYTLKQFLDDNTGKYDKYDLDSNPKTITVDNIDVAIDDNYSVIDNTKKADTSDPLKNTDRTIDDLNADGGDSNKDGVVDTKDDLRGFYIDLNNNGNLDTAYDGVIFGDLKVGGKGVYWCHTTEGMYDDIDSYLASLGDKTEDEKKTIKEEYNSATGFDKIMMSAQYGIKSGIAEVLKYTIPTKTNLNTYEFIKDTDGSIKQFEGPFGTRGMLHKKSTVTDGDRFYVMALEDIDNNTYTWYKNAYGKMDDYATYTSTDFGKGKENTSKMIARGTNNGKDPYDSSNTSDYGALSDTDVWKVIQKQASKGWFVPSRDEWNAFGAFFKVGGEDSKRGLDRNTHTYTDYYDYNTAYKLSVWCWSSSQYNACDSYITRFRSGNSSTNGLGIIRSVRFASTF